MKNRLIRSMLLVAYIGFALSGQLGSLQSNFAAGNATQGTAAALAPAGK